LISFCHYLLKRPRASAVPGTDPGAKNY
jgi:hypothetical protein